MHKFQIPSSWLNPTHSFGGLLNSLNADGTVFTSEAIVLSQEEHAVALLQEQLPLNGTLVDYMIPKAGGRPL